MLEQYKMVAVNLIASLFLIIFLLIYKFIFKKKINLFYLLILISVLPLISLLRAGDYESGDFNVHIYRIISFYDSLKEGIFMPSWAGILNATYGNPLFVFNYSLPYYFVSFFHFLNFSFISSMKIFLGSTLFFSGIFMYLWIKKITNNKIAAFTAAIFYVFNPYHLIDVHFRATLGESAIFTLVPLLLFFISSYLMNKKGIFLILTALTCQIMFLAHPMVACVFLGISILYSFLLFGFKKNKKYILFVIIALLIGFIGSIYTWFPFIYYAPYMFPSPFTNFFHFVSFPDLLFSPWRFGFLFQGHYGELSPLLGYTQILVVILSVFILIRNKISKTLRPQMIFWLVIFIAIIFFLTPFSKPVWTIFQFFSMLEGMRLLLPVALTTSTIAGLIAVYYSKTKKGRLFIYILVFITIGYTILNWGHRTVLPQINDSYLQSVAWKSTVPEGITAYFLNNKWADKNNFWFDTLPKNHFDVLSGNALIKPIERTSTLHTYIVNAKSPLTIRENTLFFPGWELTSNDKPVKIYPGNRGIINAKLPAGLQYVELSYQDVSAYGTVKKISVITLLSLAFTLLYFLLPDLKKFLSSFFGFSRKP